MTADLCCSCGGAVPPFQLLVGAKMWQGWVGMLHGYCARVGCQNCQPQAPATILYGSRTAQWKDMLTSDGTILEQGNTSDAVDFISGAYTCLSGTCADIHDPGWEADVIQGANVNCTETDYIGDTSQTPLVPADIRHLEIHLSNIVNVGSVFQDAKLIAESAPAYTGPNPFEASVSVRRGTISSQTIDISAQFGLDTGGNVMAAGWVNIPQNLTGPPRTDGAIVTVNGPIIPSLGNVASSSQLLVTMCGPDYTFPGDTIPNITGLAWYGSRFGHPAANAVLAKYKLTPISSHGQPPVITPVLISCAPVPTQTLFEAELPTPPDIALYSIVFFNRPCSRVYGATSIWPD